MHEKVMTISFHRRAPSIIEEQFCKTTILKLLSILKLDLKNLASNSFENIETPLHKKCPRSEFSGPAFSRIRTYYGEVWNISPYSVRFGKNKDQKNSEYNQR